MIDIVSMVFGVVFAIFFTAVGYGAGRRSGLEDGSHAMTNEFIELLGNLLPMLDEKGRDAVMLAVRNHTEKLKQAWLVKHGKRIEGR